MKKKKLSVIITAVVYSLCAGSAIAENTTIGKNEINNITDEVVVDTVIVGGTQNLYGSAHASNTDISAAPQQYHGYQNLYNKSTAKGTTINKDGYQTLNDNASATITVINEGGTQRVQDNASAWNTVINKNGTQHVQDNATAHDTSVTSTGRQYVSGSGQSFNTQLSNGGQQWLSENATANGTIINPGSSQYLSGASRVVDTVIIDGSQHISGHQAIAEGTELYGKSLQQLTGGTANNTRLYGTSSQTLQMQSYAPGSVTNTTLYDNSAQNVFFENSSTYDTILNDSSSQKLYWGGSAYQTVINDRAQQIVYKESYAEGTVVNGGHQLVAGQAFVHDTTVNRGGMSMLYSGSRSTGYMNVTAGGTLMMESGAYAENVSVTNGTFLVTDIDDGTLGLTPVSVDSLTMDNGRVSFVHDSDGHYPTLTIGTLSGTGSFWFNTSMAEHDANFVTIENATGQFDVIVRDSGYEISDDGLTLNLIQDKSSGAAFTLVNAHRHGTLVIDGGTYMYTLFNQENKDNLDGNIWYLGVLDDGVEPGPGPGEPGIVPPKPQTTPGTDAVLSLTAATLRVINAELDGLRTYRSTLDLANAPQSNVWGHYIGSDSRIDTSNGAAFKLAQNGMQIGADVRHTFDRGALVTGGFMSYSDNNVKHARGGKSAIDSYGLGVYATWFDHRGFYLDGVIKGNRLNNNLNARMTNGDYTGGDWHHYGFSAALEAGHRFSPVEAVNVEPYVRAQATYLNSAYVKLSNGMVADTGKPRSVIVEAGTKVSALYTLGKTEVSPYLRAGLVQESARSNKVVINHKNHFDNNLDGLSGRYGVGASVKLADNATLYGEVNYRQGKHIEEPLKGILGLKISF